MPFKEYLKENNKRLKPADYENFVREAFSRLTIPKFIECCEIMRMYVFFDDIDIAAKYHSIFQEIIM